MDTYQKVLLIGQPKSAGKTTFAMTAIGAAPEHNAANPGIKVVLQYDLGGTSIPPCVDPGTVHVRTYPPAEINLPLSKDDPELITSDQWQRPRKVGQDIINDIRHIRDAFVGRMIGGVFIRPESTDTITLTDGLTYPFPDTLILDGMTEFALILTDWILAVNHLTDASGFIENGKVNHYKLWQKRIDTIRPLLHAVIQLPCNVILTAWETQEMVDNRPTGRMVPDIGGKLDNMIPGKTNHVLRCFAKFEREVRYMVQTQPDAVYQKVGLRNYYGMPKEIDVTIRPGDRDLPWERVFGKGRA